MPSRKPETAFARCAFFLVDGARPDVLSSLLASGDLPNFARYVVEPGFCETGTTAFPSTTGPAYLPFLTGFFPGHCNIPGIRWFDREGYALSDGSRPRFRSYVGVEAPKLNTDVWPEIRSIFDLVTPHASVYSPFTRGVAKGSNWSSDFLRLMTLPFAQVTGIWHPVDSVVASRMMWALDHEWRFLFVTFPGVDELSHHRSPFAAPTLQAYRNFDKHLGRLIKGLAKQGRLHGTLFVLTADHGLSETREHFDTDTFVESRVGPTLYYPMIFRRATWKNARAATMVSGNGMCNIYLRHGERGWHGRHHDGELRGARVFEDLLASPAVDLLACDDQAGGVRVFTKTGEARLALRDGAFDYEPAHGGDPLGYGGPCTWPSARAVLADTIETHFPDAPVQLLQLFSSTRTGDLVVSAAPGHDLRADRWEVSSHHASHGSLCGEHMRVPVAMSVKGRAGVKRTADLFPAILHLLGEPAPVTDGDRFV